MHHHPPSPSCHRGWTMPASPSHTGSDHRPPSPTTQVPTPLEVLPLVPTTVSAHALLPDGVVEILPPSSRLSRAQLESCYIEGHTIQKCASPKKKALDPLRYIPERPSYFALFTVLVRFEECTSEHRVFRTFQQFGALHSKLQKKFPKSKLPKELPTMRKKRYDNPYLEQKSMELNAYLKELLDLREVKLSKLMREFLEDQNLSDSSDGEDDVPSKSLDGLPGTIVTLRPGQSFSVPWTMTQAGDVVSWQFTTKKHDIGFSATFNGETVRVYSREESQVKPVKGLFKCTEAGTLTLDWDNTYTWSKSKVLIYWSDLEQSRPTSQVDVNGSIATHDLQQGSDARRSGFIAQSFNPALYPRQIVNTSLSLITKPFIWGKSSHSQFKSGSLIVERNLKFRGRSWYRKWFVLDTHKCILRYYDSEAGARKGLSLAAINLRNQNVNLAITSNDDVAPTPYVFAVRSRNQCWKICAASIAEYNEWEHAISTVILSAQLKRRSRIRADSGNAEDNLDKHDVDSPGEDKNGIGDESEDDEDGDFGDTVKNDGDEESDGRVKFVQDRSRIRAFPINPSKAGSQLTRRHSRCLHGSNTRALTPEPRSSQSPRDRVLSMAKRILLLIWLNAVICSLRSSSTIVVVATVLVLNGFLILHALEDNCSEQALSSPPHAKEL